MRSSSRSRKAEIAEVARELADLLGELEESVAALNSIISMSTNGKDHV